MSEFLKPEILSELEAWLLIIGTTPLLAMAFSRLVRKRMEQRSGGYDEVTGEPITQGEGAHFNHNKTSPEYNTEDNGLFVNTITHWWMHLLDEDNGLRSNQNNWATKMTKKRANPSEKEKEIFGRWLD